MRTITLSIATTYVQHWGLWEAVRELLQNALDAKSKGHNMEFNEVWDGEGNHDLHIVNSGPGLNRAALLMGQTSMLTLRMGPLLTVCTSSSRTPVSQTWRTSTSQSCP